MQTLQCLWTLNISPRIWSSPFAELDGKWLDDIGVPIVNDGKRKFAVETLQFGIKLQAPLFGSVERLRTEQPRGRMRQPQRHDSLWAVGRALQLIAENTKNVGEMAACHFFVVFILNKPIIL